MNNKNLLLYFNALELNTACTRTKLNSHIENLVIAYVVEIFIAKPIQSSIVAFGNELNSKVDVTINTCIIIPNIVAKNIFL